MNIYGKLVKMRAIEKEDLVLLNKWANDPEIQYWLGGWHFPTNMEDQQKWFNSLSANSKDQRFIIETEELGIIGTANLVDINWKDRNAFHGMLLGDKDTRGKGYAFDTVMTIMKYAFEELGLERLDGSIIDYNKASIKLYTEKCGWEIEGTKRRWYFRNGKFWDKLIVGITKDKYNEIFNY
ncbi:MAG: GNAT family N-acetyltransferase [Flavobacteriales bacterium]|nr:GNAT family N-acetyltransferase [Flavobacteriales bacterium]